MRLLAARPVLAAKSNLWGAQLAQPRQSLVSSKCSALPAVRASQSRRKGSKSKKGAEKPSAPASPPRLETVAAPSPTPPPPGTEATEKPAGPLPVEAAKVAGEQAAQSPTVPPPAPATQTGVVELEDLVATKDASAVDSDDIGKAIADLKRARSERAGDDGDGSSIQKYLEGVLEESREVSWPSPGQVLSQTFIVLLITIVSTVVVSAVNALLGQISTSLFQ
eukprot:jgi/Mesvir1/5438/Mv15497-RA.1